MGVNFYGRHPDRLGEFHLGKSSAGWKFVLQANGFRYYNDWPSMKEWFKDFQILDEYNYECSVAEFIEKVEAKQSGISQCDSLFDVSLTVGGYDFVDFDFS